MPPIHREEERMVYHSIEELVGNTPLMELVHYEVAHQLPAKLLAKIEYFNPAGSAKDRVALNMLKKGFESGTINEDTVLIESTSGNTGIALCALAAARGMRVIITMPETMSIERRRLMGAYGAEIVLTEGAKGMSGAIAKAEELANTIPNSWIPGQFVNPANPEIHYQTTGPEIWHDAEGDVDIFVAGVGTGGTISGVGKYLKEQNPNVKVIAVEPASSAVLSGKEAGSHGLQGIGAGFVPETLDTSIYDEVITMDEQSAYDAGRELAAHEGLLVGISSGAAVAAAAQVAARPENKGKTIVVLLPDTGERYLTTAMFEEA